MKPHFSVSTTDATTPMITNYFTRSLTAALLLGRGLTAPAMIHRLKLNRAIMVVSSVLAGLLIGLLARPNAGADKRQNDALEFELQNGSFCPLAWSIARFKLDFSKQYGELLSQLEQARQVRDGNSEVRNAELIAMLEDALAQAKTAMPIASMEAYLARFYRATGQTNQYLPPLSIGQQRTSHPKT